MIKHPERLEDCDADLVRLVEAVGEGRDILIICGRRGEGAQEAAFETGASNAHYGESPHNEMPSRAIDVAPHPLNWDDLHSFLELRNAFELKAKFMGIELKPLLTFKNLRGRLIIDYPHYELTKRRNV